jgi:voltage-gated potassium channel
MIEGEAPPDGFGSIPATMWWAIERLITLGYGDLVPVIIFGKIVGGVVTVIGAAAVALFTSLISVSFADQPRLRGDCATWSGSHSPAPPYHDNDGRLLG